jgi:hypothetical protein
MNNSFYELTQFIHFGDIKLLQNRHLELKFGMIATHKINKKSLGFKTQNTAKKFQKTHVLNSEALTIKASITRIACLNPKERKGRQLSPLLSTSFIAAIDKQESKSTFDI